MLRIVLDTNVLVSGVILPASTPALVLRRWQARAFDVVTCRAALDELDDVLGRSHLATKYHITPEKRAAFMDAVRERVILVSGTQVQGVVSSDPKDDMFVSCAIEGEARYLVSGDRHLLELGKHGTTRIVTAARFLRICSRCERLFARLE